jgi:hypothetical protein
MLKVASIVLLGLCCGIPQALAKPEVLTVPDTPAGHVLQAWLDAFNGGDRARLEAYHAKYEPTGSADETLRFRRQTGGFELLGVDKSEPLHIEFRVKEKASPTTAVGAIDVNDATRGQVTSFRLRAIPPGMTAADMAIKVDAAIRSRVIDGIVAKLTELYVYPDAAKKMVEALRAHQSKNEYDAINDGDAFASLLTDHLRAISHDKHLRVNCVPRVLPKEDPRFDLPADAQTRARMEQDNCGFEKVERLERNIGYVKLNSFGDPSVCGPTASAAIGFLAHVDAIIFDLRDNHGGDPDMVAYLSSYLFNERTQLNDLYERKENKTTQYWTKPEVLGKKLATQPAFVLTSKQTFSGAEEFSYNLKNLKRATIVGETTGGGAHPTWPYRVEDHFAIGVPFARAINPISKTNWEGKGVEPDVKAPADQALDVAKKLAGEQLAKAGVAKADVAKPAPRKK